MLFSVIVPVYRNAEFISLLLFELERIAEVVADRFGMQMEVVFVVDGSPDDSHTRLKDVLPEAKFSSQLILHARNFGSFAAIRTGLHAAKGKFLAVMAADLQEPPELLISFLEQLVHDDCDIAIGTRESREDQVSSRLFVSLFWRLYRRFIMPDIPAGGVDVFACNETVKRELLRLEEAHSSLIGLLFWLGFRRREVRYSRRARVMGQSAWVFRKKLNYLLDSVFAFTDLPIRLLILTGMFGLFVAVGFGIIVALLRIFGEITIPGYATTIITIVFFGALNTLGIGLVGSYAWRTYENTKRRPLAVIQECESFAGDVSLDRAGASSASLRVAEAP